MATNNTNNTSNNTSNMNQLLRAVDQQEKMSSASNGGDAVSTAASSTGSRNRSAPANQNSSSAGAAMQMMPPQQRPQQRQQQQQQQTMVQPQKQQQQQQTAPAFVNTTMMKSPPNVNNNTTESINQLFQMALNYPNNHGNAAFMQSLAAGFGQQQQQQPQFPVPKPPPPRTSAAARTAPPAAAAVPPFMAKPPAPTMSNQVAAVAAVAPMFNPLEQLLGMAQLAQSFGSMVNNNNNASAAVPTQVSTSVGSSNTTPHAFPHTTSSISGSSSDNFQLAKAPKDDEARAVTTTTTTAASSSESKEDETSSNSLPKTIILPCRARGMPLDHNFRTAHFVIPHNVRHGEDLVCSYEQCRNAGNKFRYCAECRIPVAKRNFHQRHGHNLVCVSTATELKPLRTKFSAAASKNVKKCQVAATPAASKLAKKQDKKRKHAKSSKQPPQQQQMDTDSSSGPSSQPSHKRRKMEGAAHAATSNSDTGPLYPEVGDIPLTRQLRWATLLGKRPDPDDADGMSAWLLEVMTVSDLKSPLGAFASSSLTNSGSGEDDIFGESNSDSPEMGSSVNSSLSTDVLTSDVSSEEAVQDSRNPDAKAAALADGDRKMPAKSKKDRRKQQRHQEQKESKKDAGKAVRHQEKKRKAQKGREDKEKRKNKKRRSFEMEHDRSENKKKSKTKKAKTPSTKTNRDSLKAVGLSESQVKMVQEENAKTRQEELSNDSPDNEELSASYAEWQERKKQKALDKAGSPVDAVVALAAIASGTAPCPVKTEAGK